MPQLFDGTTQMLQKVMSLRTAKQQVIASNVANANTPGYSPGRMHFTEELKNAVNGQGLQPVSRHDRHFVVSANDVSEVQGRVVQQRDLRGIGDKNLVNVDQEMMALSQNQILYEAATQMLSKKMGYLKYVTQETR